MKQPPIRISLYYRTKQLMLQVTWRGWALDVEQRTIALYSPSYLIRFSRVRLNLAHGPRHHHFQQPLYRQSDLADFWGADRTQAGRKRLSAPPPSLRRRPDKPQKPSTAQRSHHMCHSGRHDRQDGQASAKGITRIVVECWLRFQESIEYVKQPFDLQEMKCPDKCSI